MVIFDKYVVLPCGSVMDFSSGEVIFSKRNSRGQKGYTLKDQSGKNHYFLEYNVLKKKRELDREE